MESTAAVAVARLLEPLCLVSSTSQLWQRQGQMQAVTISGTLTAAVTTLATLDPAAANAEVCCVFAIILVVGSRDNGDFTCVAQVKDTSRLF